MIWSRRGATGTDPTRRARGARQGGFPAMRWNMAWAVLAALTVSAWGQQDPPSAKSKGAGAITRQESANQTKGAAPTQAATAPAQPNDPAAQASLEQSLLNWEQQSTKIKTL